MNLFHGEESLPTEPETREAHNHPLLHNARLPTRQRILLALKVMGEATARALAERLHMTPMGIRRHLAILYEEGWVDYRLLRRGQGRPAHVYHLTPKAAAFFDQRYAALSVELLRYMAEEHGEEVVTHLFERRAQRRLQEALAEIGALPLPERVAALTQILDRDGYMAEWKAEGDEYFICEHHCAIEEVARVFPQACSTELTFIQGVLPDAEVERVAHIATGDHRCRYRIRPRDTTGKEMRQPRTGSSKLDTGI